MTVLRNSAVIGGIQVAFSSLFVPKSSALLASFYYGVAGVQPIPPNLVIKVYQKQVGSALLFEVTNLTPPQLMLCACGRSQVHWSRRCFQFSFSTRGNPDTP